MGDALKLYTAHEQWLLCPGHTLLRSGGRVCEDPPCATCELVHRRPPQPWRRTGMLERGLEHLDYLIAPSRAQAQLHSGLAATVPIEVIEHFVPDPAGRTGRRQGAPLLPLRRAPGAGEGRGEPDRLLQALGAGRPGDRRQRRTGAALRRRARGSPHIQFEGWVGPDRLDALYRGSAGRGGAVDRARVLRAGDRGGLRAGSPGGGEPAGRAGRAGGRRPAPRSPTAASASWTRRWPAWRATPRCARSWAGERGPPTSSGSHPSATSIATSA